MSTDQYNDDRPGLMRTHIAGQRSTLAGKRYTRDHLRAVAKAKGIATGGMSKTDIGWYMAMHGLIAPDGHLRDGFPS